MAPKKATPHASSRQTSGEYLKRVARSSGMYEPMRSRYVSALNRIWRALRYMRWPEAPPLHRDEQFEPFFVVGSGRCGTTLLRRLLMESSEAHILPKRGSKTLYPASSAIDGRSSRMTLAVWLSTTSLIKESTTPTKRSINGLTGVRSNLLSTNLRPSPRKNRALLG